MRKPKPPRNPRCHYKSFIHYLLGIVSPSLVWSVHNDKTEKYWKKMQKYKLDVIRYKIENRTCTREEYKALIRHQRTVNS